jgi:hypothetical protein
MKSEMTLHDALNAFTNIAMGVEFSPNEWALFTLLVQRWNAARRPDVIEQWERSITSACGMGRKAIVSARQNLVDAGVIYYEKEEGNRGKPVYSLNALFGYTLPPRLLSIRSSKGDSKGDVNGAVSGIVNGTSKVHSKQGKEKISKDKCTAQHGEENLPKMIEKIVSAYPKQSHHRETREQIQAAIHRHAERNTIDLLNAAEEILQKTEAIKAKLMDWPTAERQQFAPSPPNFFQGDRWADDLDEWKSRIILRQESEDRVMPSLGGRMAKSEVNLSDIE